MSDEKGAGVEMTTVKDVLTNILISSDHDLTGDGRMGLGNEDAREEIAELAAYVVAELSRHGYDIVRRESYVEGIPPQK